ncbi:MAG TPA: hypothetical protein PKK43_11030, partial [Spirochaetota bacterium]|nr:hypothetical protein [Spirochaetota bacterium]
MLNLTAKLQVNGTTVSGMSGAKIVSSLDAFMDTATIVIATGYAKPTDFSEGMMIDLSLGYTRYGLVNEFSGRIDSISPKVPVELSCVDEFYILRQKQVNRTYYKKSLSEIIEQTATGYETVFDDAARRMKVSITCPGQSARWFIAKCAKEYGFLSFFRDRKLYFVKPEFIETEDSPLAIYEEGVNVFGDNLYYHRTQLIDKVTVVSESEYGYLSKATYGKGINEKVVHIEGIGSSECYKRAKEIYDTLNYEG